MIDHDKLIRRQMETAIMVDNYEEELAQLYDVGDPDDFYWDDEDGYEYYGQETQDEEEFWQEDIISAIQVG